jgi:hypothetical protein
LYKKQDVFFSPDGSENPPDFLFGRLQRTAGVNTIKNRKIGAPNNKKRNFAHLFNY